MSAANKAVSKRAKKNYKRRPYYRKPYYRRQYMRPYVVEQKIVPDQTTGIVSSAREIGSGVGSLFGPVGSVVGGGLGSLIGSGISYFTGKGEYEIKENALMAMGDKSIMPPIINKDEGRGIIVRRSEYISDIITSATPGAFNLDSFHINPGLEETFNWLSQVAANFDEWVCEGMYFEFRSMSSDALNSTNTALGSVIMAANYNSKSPNFSSKQAMENYEGGVSIKPSQSLRYFVECAKNQTVLSDLYVRTGDIIDGTGQDIRFYDLANFQIATQGMQAASVNIGELWVTYQISLRKPKMYVAFGLYDSFYAARIVGSTDNAPLGTSVVEEGTSASITGVNNLAITITSGTDINFPPNPLPQTYIMSLYWVGTSVTLVSPSFTYGTGIESGVLISSPPSTATTTTYAYSSWFYIPGNNQDNRIVLSSGNTLPGTNSACRIQIHQVPNTYAGH